MGLLDSVKKSLGLGAPAPAYKRGRREEEREDAHAPVTVPEVTAGEVLAEQTSRPGELLLLDIREHYERAQALIPGSKHIPMNTLPSRLAELDPSQDIIVYCAHGNRSYGVTGWLVTQGYRARSLKGGIADWQHKHGPIERGYTPRS
jgi:rhodanese-related sulfurtransferase